MLTYDISLVLSFLFLYQYCRRPKNAPVYYAEEMVLPPSQTSSFLHHLCFPHHQRISAFVFCWEICVHSRCLFLSVASRLSFIELRHYIYKPEQLTSPLQLSCKGWGMFRGLTLKTPCHLLILFKRKTLLVPKGNIITPNKFMTIPWWLLPCFWEILNSLNMCMYFLFIRLSYNPSLKGPGALYTLFKLWKSKIW